MSFDPTFLLIALVVSGAGFVLFNYGRKMRRWPQGIAGAVLMVYPYFVPSPLAVGLIGVAIGAATWLAVWLGW